MTTTVQRNRGTSGSSSAQGTFDIVATNPPYGTICQTFVRGLPAEVSSHIRVSTVADWHEIKWSVIGQEQSGRTLLVSRLADIPEGVKVRGSKGTERRHLVFVEDMPVQAIPSRVPRLNVRDAHRLHLARERKPAGISAIIRRAIGGLAISQDPMRIVDAWVERATLVVLSPSFQRLYIPIAQLAQHAGRQLKAIGAFEIDEDGSYLYWPSADVHLGWEQLQGIVDPSALVAARQKTAEFNVKYGNAIRALREDQGLKQSDIKRIADRHLRRIEHGQVAATSAVLQALAESHGMRIADYLARVAERL